MSGIKLARGLSLDADYVGGGTFALLAKKGAGKTYAMRVMAEEFFTERVPFVAIDPMDAFWGLRSSANGEGAGLPIPIFGGPHGDAPLEPTGGKLMADLVVEEGLSMVLSTKHFGSRAAERRFAMDFLERLYRRNSDLVHLLIDEADLFAPQKPRRDDQPLLAIAENIVRRGRNNGIGVTMATQRPAVLNKDVLTQVDGLIVMRMLGPNDRNAIDDWVGEHGDTGQGKEVKGTLPDLATGEAWIWVPELEVLTRTKIRASHTFDSSPTRRRGTAQGREPKTLADVDLAAIQERMAQTIEKAKSQDPRELRKRIAELERSRQTVEVEKIVERTVEVPIEVPSIGEDDLKAMEAISAAAAKFSAEMREHIVAFAAHTDQLKEALRRVREAQSHGHAGGRVATRDLRATRSDRRDPEPDPATRGTQPRRNAPQDGFLGRGHRKILNALAWWSVLGYSQPSRVQVAFMAGYSPNAGHFQNLLGNLRSWGYVEYPSGGLVALTDMGEGEAEYPEAPGTTEDLHDAVLRKLNTAQVRIMRVLLERGTEPMANHELAEAAGYSAGAGHYQNMRGSLRSLGLIEYPSPGYVAALPILFLEGART